MSHQTSKRGTLLSIQYLRFVAATMVVLSHCYQIVPKYGRGDIGASFELGASGVDIFFVISGVIMCVITASREQGGAEFILRRLSRVAPIYWLMTLIATAALFAVPSLFASTIFSPQLFAASLAFFPWPNAGLHQTAPLLQVGWTLNYEFEFYLLFAVAMALSHRFRGILSAGCLLALVALGPLTESWGAQAVFFTRPILLEFIFGIGIGTLFLNGRLPGLYISVAILAVGVGTLAAMIAVPMYKDSPWRPLVWGVPAALITLGSLGIEANVRVRNIRLVRVLGDASYSIYLTHLFTLGFVRAAWGHFRLARHVSDVALLVIGVGASLAAGWLVHQFVERPLIERAHQLTRWVLRTVGIRPIAASD